MKINRKPTATKALTRHTFIFLSHKGPEEGAQVWCNAPISSQITTLPLSVGTLVLVLNVAPTFQTAK